MNIIRTAVSQMHVGEVAFACETIKLIWKGADSMTKRRRFELISFQARSFHAFAFSRKILGFDARKRKKERPAGSTAKWNKHKEKLVCPTSHLAVPNPSLPETPSSELGSKCEGVSPQVPSEEELTSELTVSLHQFPSYTHTYIYIYIYI